MKKIGLILLTCLIMAVSCTEPFDTGKESVSTRYLVVEATLTDLPQQQTILLSESIPYSGTDEKRPVGDAVITVSDLENTVRFTESEEVPGTYLGPEGFCAQSGHTYFLTICVNRENEERVYTSVATMRDLGFEFDRIDYRYATLADQDVWTIGAWGKVATGEFLLVQKMFNGCFSSNASPTLNQFEHMQGAVMNGMPITAFTRSERNIQKGDIITVLCYSLTKDYYEFLSAFSLASSGVTAPILANKPSNLPCNIEGEYVLGYFAVCPVKTISCVVDDPHRTEYLVSDEQ